MELRALMTGCSARQALSAELDAAVVISQVECFNAPLPGSPATPPKCARLYEQAGRFTLKFDSTCLDIARSNDQADQNEALALAEIPVGSLNSLQPSSLKIHYSHYYIS